MSRLPTISPSKLSLYLACPVKYYWTYEDPRGRWYLRSKKHYSFGSTLHKVLQQLHASDRQGLPTTEEAITSLDENWIDAGYSDATEMLEAQGEGKQILERYVEELKTLPRVGKTLLVEKSLSKTYDNFRLTGRVDRVDEHVDGSLEIIDYKSGRQTTNSDQVATDLGLCTYQLLLRELYPDRHISATLIALKSGIRASYAMSDAELAEFEQDVQVLSSEILAGDLQTIVPSVKPICHKCDFLPLCKKNRSFLAELSPLG